MLNLIRITITLIVLALFGAAITHLHPYMPTSAITVCWVVWTAAAMGSMMMWEMVFNIEELHANRHA